MAATTPFQPCTNAGACQGRKVPCLTCANDPKPWTPNDEVTCSPMEMMGYWISIVVVACLSLGTVVGIACFIYGRWFA